MEESGCGLEHEDLLIRLRAKLNEEKVKLWEPPYSENSSVLQELSRKYAESLKKSQTEVLSGLEELQKHAISRARANSEFKESGVATLRVRASIPNDRMRQFTVQNKLEARGNELLNQIALQLGINENRLKLIMNGKVIKPQATLQEQGVKNGGQLIALIMAESAQELQKRDGMYAAMQATRDDADLLMQAESDVYQSPSSYMKLEDQNGRAIDIPESERRALMVGLALHEHGRTAVRKEDYRLALVLLLEADSMFSQVDSSVLNSVDNWALLQLDVAWCYLCLQSLSAAADADQRLQRAEKALKASYGENMERLIALKGNDANERILIMRMHLLQAIVAYHQNQRDKARTLIDKAEEELNALRVNESDVTALLELGWSRTQARTGLRAAGGCPNAAHNYLTQLKETRKRARKQSKKERQQRSLGLCLDGTPVSGDFVALLTGMGYPRRVSVAALKNSNNRVSEAVRIIQEQPELIASAIEESDSTSSLDASHKELEVDEECLAKLVSLGYDQNIARASLKQVANDLEAAVELLARGEISIGSDPGAGPSSASGPSSAAKRLKQKMEDEKRKQEEREKALERLTEAIEVEDDSHLDSTLQQEEHFLSQYKSLLL